MPRILILHASVGTGHKSAANALAAALNTRPNTDVRVEDTLEYATTAFRELYISTYLRLTTYAPRLWEMLYKRLDTTDPTESANSSDLRGAVSRLGVNRLNELIDGFRPHVIVCTHPLPAELLLRDRKEGNLHTPIFLTITDHVAHDVWIVPGIDGYFVPSELPRELMIGRGVAADIVHITGIPVLPALAVPKDPAAIRTQLGFAADTPLVTFFGGGIVTERARQVVIGLLKLETPALLAVVAGRNAELAENLADLTDGSHVRLLRYGLIDYVDDLVVASDVAITKAGGLIISEIMARGTPLLVFDPIPGHEEWNADYVVVTGAGIQLRMPETVPQAIGELLRDPQRLSRMRERAGRAARPDAAQRAADIILRSVA